MRLPTLFRCVLSSTAIRLASQLHILRRRHKARWPHLSALWPYLRFGPSKCLTFHSSRRANARGSILVLEAMEFPPRGWLHLRVALVALAVPLWVVVRSRMPDDFSGPPAWYFPLILAAFAVFSVMFVCVLRPDLDWSRPVWSANPFLLRQPLQGLHLSGWSFVVGAAGLLVQNVSSQASDWSWVLPGSIGLGWLVGIELVSIRARGDGL